MKAYWIRTQGREMVLESRDTAVPEPGPGEVRVHIHAASLNRGEFVAGHGLHASNAPARPAGFEAAGEVDKLGPGITRLRIGDRVMGRCDGAFAEYGCMLESEALPVPAALSWEQAAGTSLVFNTVHDVLIGQGRLRAGEWLLIVGASSGVGVAALQVAKAMGARVIGTSGSPQKLARLQAMGLDVALQTRGPDFAQAVMKATADHGADLAVNNVGGTMFDACVQALAFEGRMATVGYVDGVLHADMDIGALHRKRLCLYGVSNKLRTAAQRAEATRRFAEDLMPYFADGRIVPVVDRVFSFWELKEAKRCMEANEHLGKLVVRME